MEESYAFEVLTRWEKETNDQSVNCENDRDISKPQIYSDGWCIYIADIYEEEAIWCSWKQAEYVIITKLDSYIKNNYCKKAEAFENKFNLFGLSTLFSKCTVGSRKNP